MTTSLSKESLPADFDAMEQLAVSMRKLNGGEVFESAAHSFIDEGGDVQDAVAEMEEFFRGAMVDSATERKRIIELTKTLETMCGTPSIWVSILGCTAAFSCSGFCC